MKQMRGYNTLACLTVFLGILTYALADGNVSLAVFAAPIVIGGWWTARRGDSPWTLPRWVINALVLLAVLNSAVQVIVLKRHEALVSDLSDFLVFIQLIKLFDRRKSRDDAQLLALSLFIVIGAILTDNSLAVGLCLLVYTPLATWTIMRHQLQAGAVDMAETQRSLGVPPAPRLAAGPGSERHFRRLTAAAVAMSLAASIVIFLFMPRGFGGEAFGTLGRPAPGSVTGFVDSFALGAASGLISESQRPVMDVQLFENGRSVGADSRTLYLRGAILDRYEQGKWSRIRDSFEKTGGDHSAHVPFPISSADGPVSKLHIHMRNASYRGGYLFTMWRPVSITSDQTLHLVRLDTSGDLVVRYKEAKSRSLNTLVEFVRDPGVVPPRRDSPIPPRPPETTFVASRIGELSASLLRAENISLDPAQRDAFQTRLAVNTLQSYLRQTCRYTLEQEVAPWESEPIEWFIFDRRMGHCEYFASALVAMCWSVGIDARLVTGYVATEYDESNKSYLVREANAHAWVEAELSPGRWVTFDPTPPADLDRIHRARPGIVGQLRRFYEQLEFGWATSIVSFDANRRARVYEATLGQSSLVESVRTAIERVAARVRSLLSFIPVPTDVIFALVYFGIIVVLLALTWFVSRLVVRRLLLRLHSRRGTAPDPDLAALLRRSGFYREALDLLVKAGVEKPAQTPPLAHAAALNPALREPFAELSRLFYRLRFGRRELSETEAAEAEQLVARLRAAVEGR